MIVQAGFHGRDSGGQPTNGHLQGDSAMLANLLQNMHDVQQQLHSMGRHMEWTNRKLIFMDDKFTGGIQGLSNGLHQVGRRPHDQHKSLSNGAHTV